MFSEHSLCSDTAANPLPSVKETLHAATSSSRAASLGKSHTMWSPDTRLQRALGDNQAQPLFTDEKNQDSKKTGLIQNQHQVMASAEMESQNRTYKA